MQKIRLISTLRYIKIPFFLSQKDIQNLLNSRHCAMHREGNIVRQTSSLFCNFGPGLMCNGLCPWLIGANSRFIASDQKQILKQAGSNNNYSLFRSPGFVYDTSEPLLMRRSY